REPGRQELVRPGDVRGTDAAPRDGGRYAQSLCGGIHRAKGRVRGVKFVEMELAGADLIEPEGHEDERGCLARRWDREPFAVHGLSGEVLQCSISRNTRAGTLRGMHFQTHPHEEVKLVRC